MDLAIEGALRLIDQRAESLQHSNATALLGGADRARSRVNSLDSRAEVRLQRAIDSGLALKIDLGLFVFYVSEEDKGMLWLAMARVAAALERALPYRDSVQDAAECLSILVRIVQGLQPLDGKVKSPAAGVDGNQPSRMAVNVTRYSVRLLPLVHRERYSEELQGELAEFADGHNTWKQLVYAARILCRGFMLRRVLRDAALEVKK